MQSRRMGNQGPMHLLKLSLRHGSSRRGLLVALCFIGSVWWFFIVAPTRTAAGVNDSPSSCPTELGDTRSHSSRSVMPLVSPHMNQIAELWPSNNATAGAGSKSWDPSSSLDGGVQTSIYSLSGKVESWAEWALQPYYSQISSLVASLLSPFLWSVNRPSPESFAIFSPSTPDMRTLDEDAAIVGPIVQRLKQRTFFKIFNVDLDKPCPFWAAEALCRHEGSCSVCQCDDHEIPVAWKMKPTEEFVNRKHAASFTPWDGAKTKRKLGDSNGFGFVTNQMRGPKGSYVDLSLNPPSFTAFKGGPVWDQIYRENCMRLTNPLDGLTDSGECREEEMFFRLISGLHSNIAALSSEYYYPAKPMVPLPEGRHEDARHNMDFFREKLGIFPERISNLYFTFSVLLKTVCELGPVLQECSCEAGNASEDLAARADLLHLLNQTFGSCDAKFTEAPLFNRRSSSVIRQFHNITRVLDCVECQKCRLHGKLKMTALQVALRASAADTYVQSLERNEITALINALAYFTEAVQILGRFESRLFWIRVLLVVRVLVALVLVYVAAMCGTRLWSTKKAPLTEEAGDNTFLGMAADHIHSSTPTSAGSSHGTPSLSCAALALS
eukprot:GHVS01049408.1.p1 GENE.GHVS01049408.1~~GHVS01049408.1.p1  ORF type:complete len:611 (+),score=42.94 GHVS01049408.1:113-1945(+)